MRQRISSNSRGASSEEDVAEIFVRINNQGKRLGQADFVLTLLSVFHGELRDQIQDRARRMSSDGMIAIDTQQLLRASCGVAFDRARMSAVYRYLRGIDPATGDDRWGRMCAEHALPLGWESMEYDVFLAERRRRMADVIRVAFRKLGGEEGAPPLTPPWFLPGAEAVWRRIAEVERALRGVVRAVYATRFGDAAPRKIEEGLGEGARETLARALRARPEGAEPLSVVDYLYLGQLPALLFAAPAWEEARKYFGEAPDVKKRLDAAVGQVAPIRNEIAHVREVERDRLLRADLACADVLQMLGGRSSRIQH